MLRSEFHISKMDYPSEENMIRLKLEHVTDISKLELDLDDNEHIMRRRLFFNYSHANS